MKNEDYASKDYLKSTPLSLDEKFRRAREQLGERYLCHEVNRVQKRTEPKDSSDVAVIFRAVA